MTNKELQEKLKQFPDDLPVVVQDGMDPSDFMIAHSVDVTDCYFAGKKVIAIES